MRRPLVLLATALVPALSGCGTGDVLGGGRGPAAAPAVAAPRTVPAPGGEAMQVANGPVVVGPGPKPLAVRLERPDRIHVRFHTPPRAGLLFDLDTGEVLWRRNPTRILPIASLTKMMTALVAVKTLPAGSKVYITHQAVAAGGSKVGVLPRGKRVGITAMLHGLLLPSGNDAAMAIAHQAAGSVPAFVRQMNATAADMRLTCTHYSGPDGLDDAGNRSCAVDLAAEARAVLDTPRLAPIVRRFRAVLPFPIKGGKIYLYNNNPLLRLNYPGTLGVKTGYTDAAGRCLVGAARRFGHRLGVVLLHSPDIGVQGIKLLDRGFRWERARG